MHIEAGESHVTIETTARGLLAAAAHDLRIAAPIAAGAASPASDDAADPLRCTARFPPDQMRVKASRRHGTSEWHDPTTNDARDIEGRIRSEVFAGVSAVVVDASVASADATRARIVVRASRTQTVDVPVRIERDGDTTRVSGRCDLSLEALGTGKVRVPLGAIKVDDRVSVEFAIVLRA
jgi:hypothetical protein